MPLQFLLFSPWGATHVVCAFGGSYIAIDVMSKDEVGVFGAWLVRVSRMLLNHWWSVEATGW